MGKFIVRIQLQKADETDYDRLNIEMNKEPLFLKKGYSTGKGNAKKGEYNYKGINNLKDVADAVYRVVRKTGRNYSFTIMKSKANFTSDN